MPGGCAASSTCLVSFVILDGHYRLQAAIAEEIPPSFLVLSELQERDFAIDQENIRIPLEDSDHIWDIVPNIVRRPYYSQGGAREVPLFLAGALITTKGTLSDAL